MADEKATFQVVIMERREGEFKALQKEKERRLEDMRYRRQQEREVRAKRAVVSIPAETSLTTAQLALG